MCKSMYACMYVLYVCVHICACTAAQCHGTHAGSNLCRVPGGCPLRACAPSDCFADAELKRSVLHDLLKVTDMKYALLQVIINNNNYIMVQPDLCIVTITTKSQLRQL